MFAVISFRTGPGRSEFTFFWGKDDDWFDASYYNDIVWQDRAAQEAWAAMWQHTAARYRDNPIVVGYDLMVEPNANEVWLDVWDPGESQEVTAFNFRYGPDPHHDVVVSNALMDTIVAAWGRNGLRPSQGTSFP
jgi:hypothetical protein